MAKRRSVLGKSSRLLVTFLVASSVVAYASSDQTKRTKAQKAILTEAVAAGTVSTSSGTGPFNCAETESCAGSAEIARPLQATLVPDLFTGTTTLKIPIHASPGRNGMQPNLALTYRSSHSNGWIGMGWDLDVGSIERSTIFGLDYGADDFELSLNGTKEPLWKTASDQEYHEKTQVAFFRIRQHTATDGKTYWEVTDKKGMRYLFGETADSRQDDPANNTRIFKWNLDRVEDPNGNYMLFGYKKKDELGEIYLQRIDYTAHAALAANQSVDFLVEDRPDFMEMFGTSFSVKTTKRLTAIVVSTHDLPGHVSVIRRYQMEYDYSPSSSRSRLVKITQTGTQPLLTLPAIRIQYQGDKPDLQKDPPWSGGPDVDAAVRKQCLSGDFNGDGRTDLACYSGKPELGWAVALSTGHGWSTTMWGGGASVRGPHVHFPVIDQCTTGDFNGDGKTDIACYTQNGQKWHVALSTGSGWAEGCPKYCWDSGPIAGNYLSDNCVFGDFNGDGKTDVACYTQKKCTGIDCKWYVALSTGQGWQGTYWDNGPLIQFISENGRVGHPATDRCIVGDLNGDGKADVACRSDTSGLWFVGLSTGGGWRSSVWQAPPSTDNTIWRECVSGDFNGDGRTDLACYSGGQWNVGLSTGTKFEIHPWGPSPALDGCAVAEFVGDGKAALGCKQLAVPTAAGWSLSDWSKQNLVSADPGNCFLGDFNGDGKTDFACNAGAGVWTLALSTGPAPDLLVAMTDSFGATTHITYGFSSTYDNTQLPFVVNAVESIITDDGRGVTSTKKLCSTTTFCYHGGFYDIPTREFRGFNSASLVDPGSPSRDGNVRQSWFYQGNEARVGSNDPYGLVGKLRRIEVRDLSTTRLLTVSSNEYAPNSGSPPYFSPVSHVDSFTCSNVGTQCDDTDQSKHTTTSYKYDPVYGNLVEMTFHDRDDQSYDRSITRSYSDYNAAWIVGLVTNETKFRGIHNRVKVASTSFSYDDVGDDCRPLLPPSQVPRGNLTTTTRWLDTAPAKGPKTMIGYNNYGNPVCLRDARGHAARTSYDTGYVFPTMFTNALGQNVNFKYYGITDTPTSNGLFGQLESVTDPNGVSVRYEYDSFGRLDRVKREDGSSDQLSYRNMGSPATQNIEVVSASGLSDARYFDGMGRTWRDLSTGPDVYPISIEKKYTGTGDTSAGSLPYLYNKEQPNWSEMTYDALGRVKVIKNADKSESSYCYADWSASVVDPNGHLTRTSHDAFGRIVRVEEFRSAFKYDCAAILSNPPAPYATTVYEYDTVGNPRLTRDAKGNQTELSYDSLSRVIVRHSPDSGKRSFEYDENGNVIREEDALHNTQQFEYDDLDRLTRKHSFSVNGNRQDMEYKYDRGTNGVGRLSSVTDHFGTTTFGYDAVGRITEKARSVKKARFTFKTQYDLDGRIKTLSYPHGTSISYRYAGPFLSNVVSSANEEYYAATDYTALGQARTVKYGNGLDTRSTFYESTNKQCDKANFRLCSAQVARNSDIKKALTYEYDGKGNVQTVTNEMGMRLAFGYDEIDRLIYQKQSGSLGGVQASMSYDEIGNLTSYSPIGSYTYSANGVQPHAVLHAGSSSFQYDMNGDLVRGANRELVFDSVGHLVHVTIKGHEGGRFWWLFPPRRKTEIGYAWDGSRIFTKADRVLPYPLVLIVGKKKTDYLGNLYECNRAKCDAYIFADGKRVLRVDFNPKESRYYHSDVIGSTRYVSDQRGSIVQTFDYLPFGASEKAKRPQNQKVLQRFTGQMFDESTGLYYYQSRYYDPAIGRFVSPDTYLGSMSDPQSLNLYSYVLNNPETFIDPTGHITNWTGWSFLGGGVLSMGMSGATLAALSLAPETGGLSLIAVGLSAGMGMSSGIASTTVGGLQLAGAINLSTSEAQAVKEAFAMSSGQASLIAEVYAVGKGFNYEDRMATMKMAEAVDAGLEFGSGSVGILRGETQTLGESALGWISAGKYLSNNAFDSTMTSHELAEKSTPADRGRIERPMHGEVKDTDKDEMEVEVRPYSERDKHLIDELQRQENTRDLERPGDLERPDKEEKQAPVEIREKP